LNREKGFGKASVVIALEFWLFSTEYFYNNMKVQRGDAKR
jgi:hypothetical protein